MSFLTHNAFKQRCEAESLFAVNVRHLRESESRMRNNLVSFSLTQYKKWYLRSSYEFRAFFSWSIIKFCFIVFRTVCIFITAPHLLILAFQKVSFQYCHTNYQHTLYNSNILQTTYFNSFFLNFQWRFSKPEMSKGCC